MGILLAIHVLVTIMLILIVLIQKNEGGSSLFANSGGGGMFNARGTSSILTKTTWTLATIFIVNCVIMATISSRSNRVTLIAKRGTPQQIASKVPNSEEDDDDDIPVQAGKPNTRTQPANTPQRSTPSAERTQPRKQGSTALPRQPSPPPAAEQTKPAAPAGTGVKQ
ncbi:MAG: preprotein translocase subunit SecG [Holosporales bacterium]|jgi:preprotein translocase subunit SecG|nr:preprotein translocase subunit SecG [Holosporales bacterium]